MLQSLARPARPKGGLWSLWYRIPYLTFQTLTVWGLCVLLAPPEPVLLYGAECTVRKYGVMYSVLTPLETKYGRQGVSPLPSPLPPPPSPLSPLPPTHFFFGRKCQIAAHGRI